MGHKNVCTWYDVNNTFIEGTNEPTVDKKYNKTGSKGYIIAFI